MQEREQKMNGVTWQNSDNSIETRGNIKRSKSAMAVNPAKQESYSELDFYDDRHFTKQPSNSGIREEEKFNMIESFGSPLIV